MDPVMMLTFISYRDVLLDTGSNFKLYMGRGCLQRKETFN